MVYQKFEGKSFRKGRPTLAIRQDGRMRLNSDATLQAREKGVERVYILWDKQRRKLALQKATVADGSSYKLTFSTKQNSIDIGAKAFLKHIGWNSSVPVDLPLEWNETEKMFEAKLPRNLKSESDL